MSTNDAPKAEHLTLSRYTGIRGGSNPGTLSYAQVDAGLLQRAITETTLQGDAVMFARTSDGGAFSVRVLSGQSTYKWYPADAIELTEILQQLADEVPAMRAERAKRG